MSYHRHSIRLRKWDYTNKGYYFVTICSQNRINYFWNVGADRCVRPEINEIGKLIDYWWHQIPIHFENILLDEFVMMPNHLHGMLIIKNENLYGADTSVCPYIKSPVDLGNIIQWFKTMTTNEYLKNIKLNNWPRFEKRLWQRNYYERIIRNEREFERIRKYIRMNPLMRERDRN